VLHELEQLPASVAAVDGVSLEVVVLLHQARCFPVGGERLPRYDTHLAGEGRVLPLPHGVRRLCHLRQTRLPGSTPAAIRRFACLIAFIFALTPAPDSSLTLL